jgi:hypothetical protein
MEPSGNTWQKAEGARWLGVGGGLANGLVARPVVLAAIVALVILFAGTIGLWMHYGTAVFYEMIAAGLAACL